MGLYRELNLNVNGYVNVDVNVDVNGEAVLASPKRLMGTLMGTLMCTLTLMGTLMCATLGGSILELDWGALRSSIFASNWASKSGHETEAQMLLSSVLFFDMLRELGF